MSTSLLYHGFSLVGYDYVRTRYEGRSITFTIRHKVSKLCCPVCGSRKLIMRGTTRRRFRSMPIGFKNVFSDLSVQRVGCLRCGSSRQVSLGFADPRFSYTRAFERYALRPVHNSSSSPVRSKCWKWNAKFTTWGN